jgi:hypothetical protein
VTKQGGINHRQGPIKLSGKARAPAVSCAARVHYPARRCSGGLATRRASRRRCQWSNFCTPVLSYSYAAPSGPAILVTQDPRVLIDGAHGLGMLSLDIQLPQVADGSEGQCLSVGQPGAAGGSTSVTAPSSLFTPSDRLQLRTGPTRLRLSQQPPLWSSLRTSNYHFDGRTRRTYHHDQR